MLGPPRVARAEDRLDVGRVGLHIRHHHHHVVGRQPVQLVEGRQQLIAHHLHLPQRAVAAVEAEGVVEAGENRLDCRRLWRGVLAVGDVRL